LFFPTLWKNCFHKIGEIENPTIKSRTCLPNCELTFFISIIVGFSVLIPYVGAFLATIPVIVVALLQFGIGFDFYMIVGLYLLLQALDGNLLVPILFSDAVKLHPVVIMLAVFIFGGIFGFWGAFFSIPLATFIKAVWNSWPSTSAKHEY